MTFEIDGVRFEARSAPELSFLSAYGRVFRVMDGLLSGNLCFGVEGRWGRLFIKYAGAETVNYTGRPRDAVQRLINGERLSRLAHPAMTRLLTAGPTAEGYALVYEWFDGMPLRPAPGQPDAVRQRLQHLPLPAQLELYEQVLSLHLFLEEKGYMAVDFSDGNVLLNLDTCTARVCDTDLYLSFPAANTRGRMPGDSDFLAPEEFRPDALITPSATVYKLGRLAFSFFSKDASEEPRAWQAPEPLRLLALEATAPRAEKRIPTVERFVFRWREELRRVWVR